MPETVRARNFFAYPVPAVTLAPGANATATVRIESSSDFYWIKGTYWAEDNTGVGGQTDSTRIIPSVDLQIQSSGADRNLFNGFVPVPSVFGTGQIPFVLPFPAEMLANSEVRFDFISREAARTLDVYLVLHGWKDFGELELVDGGGAAAA